MKLSRISSLASLFLAVILSAPGFAATDAHSALPGTLNYVEGQVNIGSDTLNASSIGSTTLEPNQTLDTGSGKAEILLTPGVFLRVGSNSAVKMISPGLTNTQLRLDQGRAMVEVAEIHDQNDLRITEDGFTTQLMKKGLYAFDADNHEVLVFKGKAHVQDGDRTISVGEGKRLDLNSADLKPHGFDKDEYKQSDLYQWSSLRSSYLAEANVDAARVYVADGYYGPEWLGAGWYWAPGFGTYTFVPGNGVLYSPFGWGFYSPLVVYRSPVFYRFGGWPHRPGYIVRPGVTVVPGRPAVTRPAVPRPAVRPAPAFHGGFPHGGFGGRPTMIHR
jgi:FecR protein